MCGLEAKQSVPHQLFTLLNSGSTHCIYTNVSWANVNLQFFDIKEILRSKILCDVAPQVNVQLKTDSRRQQEKWRILPLS